MRLYRRKRPQLYVITYSGEEDVWLCYGEWGIIKVFQGVVFAASAEDGTQKIWVEAQRKYLGRDPHLEGYGWVVQEGVVSSEVLRRMAEDGFVPD